VPRPGKTMVHQPGVQGDGNCVPSYLTYVDCSPGSFRSPQVFYGRTSPSLQLPPNHAA
jgi:hypothetical protein